MTLLRLQINYCVLCGARAGTEPYFCLPCSESGAELPVQYRFDRRYHCVYCGKILDRYYDFFSEGSFKSEDYRCIGCDAVTENAKFDHRKYADKAVRYMKTMLETTDLPPHVQQAYQRQLRTMLNMEHLCVN